MLDPDDNEEDEIVIKEFARERLAGITLTETADEVRAEPSTVAEIAVAVPEVVPVKVAV
jgi:hypothetical protein